MSLNWFEKLKEGLMVRDFTPSEIEPCLYLKNDMVVLRYVDEFIIAAQDTDAIDAFVKSMKDEPKKLILTDEGDVNRFLGTKITQIDDLSYECLKPFLIDRIVNFL